MTHIRPIETDELSTFIRTATEPENVDDVRQYVEDLISKGAMRREWCYLAERNGHPVGRAAFWTLPKRDQPVAIILLDLPWQRTSAFETGAALLETMLDTAHSLGTKQLEYVLDTPVQQPQWQAHPESRTSLVEQCGFSQIRETVRFEFKAEEMAYPPSTDHELTYRSLEEIGENPFKDAIRRVSVGSLDQRIQEQRKKVGPAEDAIAHFESLTSLAYDPSWWELAWTPDEELVGVIMPTRIPAGASIGYIGVVPEMRGQQYVDALLTRGTRTILKTGAERIVADADTHNTPMTAAFERVQYEQFANRREYCIQIDEQMNRADPSIA